MVMKQVFRPSLLCILLLAGGSGCTALRERDQAPLAVQPSVAPAPAIATSPALEPPPNPSSADVNYVARVVQQVGPAVVRIDSTRTVRDSIGRFGIEEFLGGRIPQQRQRVQRGTGSGFITAADGQVITNAHVVEGADVVTVVLKDGRRFRGDVAGVDPLTDLAVIKISANNLPTVKLGNSDSLLPGQWAIAIGNPLGLDNTVTQGIISATGRSSADVGEPDKRIDFIQTDAAINPGNSGGPLLNAEGEVIGVNTAIIQGAQGIGFAIPINTAQRVAQQLATKGRAEHPYLGIQMTELSPEIQQAINQSDLGVQINRDQGVVVVRVQRGSPADRAGMRPGDVIERVNGQAVQDSRQIQRQVDATGVGNALQITVNRNGRSQDLAVRPEPLPMRQRQEQG